MASKCMKKCSTSLVIKETQIKTLRFHLTPVRMTIIKGDNNNKCWRGCGESAVLLTTLWKEAIKNWRLKSGTSGSCL
jgi:hypothetical protein